MRLTPGVALRNSRRWAGLNTYARGIAVVADPGAGRDWRIRASDEGGRDRRNQRCSTVMTGTRAVLQLVGATAALLIAACGGPLAPTAPTGPTAPAVTTYLTGMLDIMQAHSVNRQRIEW